MCAVSMVVGAPRNCSRFVCRYGFHEDVLDAVYVPILLYCCTRIQYFTLAIILSDAGERMHRDKVHVSFGDDRGAEGLEARDRLRLYRYSSRNGCSALSYQPCFRTFFLQPDVQSEMSNSHLK